MLRSRIPVVVLSALLALAAAACSSGAPSASPASAKTVPVVLGDAMTFNPASLTFRQGDTVTFNVINEGRVAHEFFVGSEAAQAEHAVEMERMGAMGHDHATGVHVDAGKSKMLHGVVRDHGLVPHGLP